MEILKEVREVILSEYAKFVFIPLLIVIAISCFIQGILEYPDLMDFVVKYSQGYVALFIAFAILLYQREVNE